VLVKRGNAQPESTRPDEGVVKNKLEKLVDEWTEVVRDHLERKQDLEYVQYSKKNIGSVVLGDSHHEYASRSNQGNIRVVYRNVPTSLRSVEEETAFET
ncbi:MAG: hypothetical protein MPK75_11055, partial [Alphaproteobacteria bacterium]|nr:hypothetical protein [Alphaproteobacteria bacterium]